MKTEFGELVRVLTEAGVDFIVIGGVAANLQGAARITYDLDVAYDRSSSNLARLVAAIGPLHPYLRGAPPGLPFRFDVNTLRSGLNFTLTTDIGPFDLLGEVAGGGDYQRLLPHSREVDAFGVRCQCLDLDTLITVKRAAGRPKDFEAIAELEIIRDLERDRAGD
jgi:predicted nucleotidyltransferase